MDNDAIKRLRELAERATEGPWQDVEAGDNGPPNWMPLCDVLTDDHMEKIAEYVWPTDAAYIAAASPDVVTALLDEREVLRRERDSACEAQRAAETELAQQMARLGMRADDAVRERDAAMALLRRSRRYVEQDAQMMDDISRHAPLDADSQATHDATEYESERLMREIDALLGDGGEPR
jgi:hypothetical protein